MKNKGSELHEISLLYHGDTDKAICVSEDNKTKKWLPKSQIEYKLIGENTVEVILPQWLYEKNEFAI